MSSTIIHKRSEAGDRPPARRKVREVAKLVPVVAVGKAEKDASLVALGERIRALRARRGLTRKAVAQAAEISDRYLANLEYGIGNASILILQQIAGALQCPVAELTGDVTTSSPEWLLIRELLENRSEGELPPVPNRVPAGVRRRAAP